MFKKKCKGCGKKVSRGYDYCPHCGTDFRTKEDIENEEKDFGMFGKNDFFDVDRMNIKLPFGFNTIFNSLVKQIDKQFKEIDKEISQKKVKRIEFPKDNFLKSGGISISISSSSGKEPVIRVRNLGNLPEFRQMEHEIKEEELAPIPLPHPSTRMDSEKEKQISKLPRKEAETKVRRLSNRIIYEISLPGVKSEKDIIINKLENSIEIKAFSKDNAFIKLIPINLPILKHSLKDGKLILEIKAE